jgi:non-ribosomal peptide synthetase component F
MPLIVRDLFALYAGHHLPPVPPYRDYVAWLAGQDQTIAEAAWAAALAGARPTLLAPGRPDVPLEPAKITFDHPAAAVRERARRAGVTVNTVVQSAWATLLRELTGRDDVLFGAVVSGRPPDLPGVEDMVGLFATTVPVRVRGSSAERLQEEQSRLRPHHHLGLGAIQRLAGAGDLFDSLVVFENYPVSPGALSAPPECGLTITGVDGSDAAHYPLTLVVSLGQAFHGRVEYRPDVFTEADVRRLLKRLLSLLQ